MSLFLCIDSTKSTCGILGEPFEVSSLKTNINVFNIQLAIFGNNVITVIQVLHVIYSSKQ